MCISAVACILLMFSSGLDFVDESPILVTLPAGVTMECLTINIINDKTSEGNERFGIALDPVFAIETVLSTATVIIIDDDS